MQISLTKLTNEWVTFQSILGTSVDAEATYSIQNRGAEWQPFLACEASSAPTDTAGMIVQPFSTLIYKKGEQTLYLRALNDSTTVNIAKDA